MKFNSAIYRKQKAGIQINNGENIYDKLSLMARPVTSISTLGVIKSEMGSSVLIKYLRYQRFSH